MFKSQSLLRSWRGLSKLPRILKPMILKQSWVVPHHKVVLADIGPMEINASSLVANLASFP